MKWLLVTLALVTGCPREPPPRPASDPVVAPRPSAPASAASPPSPRKESFVHVGDCSAQGSIERQVGCDDLLSPRNLPALDATGTKLAVAAREEHGLGTPWNLTVRILAAKDGALLESLPVFVEADYAPFDLASKKGLLALQAAMAARAALVEARLGEGGFAALGGCTSDPGSTNDTPFWCGGHDRWSCSDLSLALTGPSGGQLRDTLTLRQGASVKKLSTKAWRRPPVPNPGVGPKATIATGFCITGAHRLPASSRVLLEVTHICLGGGDWCSPGGPSFHLVEG